MSNGREEVTLENEVVVAVDVPVEELLESQENGGNNEKVVDCIQVDISERDRLLPEDGDLSGQSSAAATPLERSQEVLQEGTAVENVAPLLKEWNSLINILARIPVKAQKGLSTFDLKLTCISTIAEEILLIGTNVGVVYWYNRKTDVLDRLRCEVSVKCEKKFIFFS